MQRLLQDLRYGARGLAKDRGFTIAAILTLAFGIGATTAIFSFVDAVLLKPLAYKDAERLVTLWDSSENCRTCLPSPPTFLEWKTMNTVFEEVAGYTDYTQSLNLTGGERAEQVQGRQVTSNYFDMLGVEPALGRTFRVDEEQVGNERVVILAQKLWRRRFGADQNIVGASITLNDHSYVVVGVLPPHEIFDRMDNELWTPLTIPPDRMRRNTQYFSARAKLKPGVTLAQAIGDMQRLSESVSQTDPAMKGHVPNVEPLRQSIVTTDLRGTLWLLLGAVGFILLIASVNVGNLLVARGSARRKEVLIRLAVGASSWRLMQQLLTESLLLASIGGAAGWLLAYWLMKAFLLLSPAATIPREASAGLDFRVLTFTFGISMLTGIFFGLIPAWQSTRANVSELIKGSVSLTSARNVSRQILLISEVALTLVLVVGAVLMLNSFSRLLRVDPGFEAERVLTLRSTLPKTRFPTAAQTLTYQNEFLTRLRAMPYVKAAGVTSGLPMSGVSRGTDFRILSKPTTRGVGVGNARFRAVDSGYFKALGLRLMRGRFISERDTLNSQLVVVINQTLANNFFSGSDAIGEQILFAGPQPYTIVGVAGDVKYNGLAAETPIEIYVPLAQLAEGWFDGWGRQVTFVAQTDGNPRALIGAVSSLAVDLNKDQPLYEIKTMSDVVADSAATPRFRTFLFFVFGALALALAAVGVYGVIAHATAQRTREIGIRVALGAQRSDIFKLVVGQGLTLTATGLLIGIGGAIWLTRFLSSQLFHLSATDVNSYAVASVATLLVASLACYLPARRATKVNPVVALRHD